MSKAVDLESIFYESLICIDFYNSMKHFSMILWRESVNVFLFLLLCCPSFLHIFHVSYLTLQGVRH